jgi:hypothetical protein
MLQMHSMTFLQKKRNLTPVTANVYSMEKNCNECDNVTGEINENLASNINSYRLSKKTLLNIFPRSILNYGKMSVRI